MPAEPGQPTIGVRVFTEDDFPLMPDWLQRPHVKEWWDDGDDTLEKVEGSLSLEDWLGRYILQLDGVDAGYFQSESETPGLIGTRSVKAFIAMIASLEDVDTVKLDPEPRKKRAIRCYEKVGFRHTGTGPGWEGATAYFMELDYSDHDF